MKKIISILISFTLPFSLAFPLTAFAASDCTGGTITYSGGNTIHTFTSSGTFDCTSAGSGNIQVLVVAGGGGGGSGNGGTPHWISISLLCAELTHFEDR